MLVRGGLSDDLRAEIRKGKAELLRLLAGESVLELEERLGRPRIELLRDNWTPGDEAGWRDFIATAPREDVELAAEILQCRLVEGEHGPASEEPRGDRAGGRRLLHALWAGGFELRLERSASGDGFIIVRVGQARPGTDFEALYAMFERFHDAAVQLLVETCGRLRISPEKWHEQAPAIWKRLTAANVGDG
ncbi:MAG: hypothetical protein GYA33_13970 [Thermogutta sp.]|nr:hypothetical protein [Thermogutta sp.]